MTYASSATMVDEWPGDASTSPAVAGTPGGPHMPQRTCSVEGCEKPHLARGWCSMHYNRWKRYGSALLPPSRYLKRPRFVIDPETGCWNWQLNVDVHGYGRVISDAGTRVLAHRYFWELVHGALPRDLDIDHLCRNRSCVNPAHLEPVTNVENVRRGEGPSARNARKTHCKYGHEFTAENTYVRLNGGRACRACHARRMRERAVRMRVA